ncbi:MAG TPA: NUDIX hydrolase [Burkholderiales bacterium]|nr:NUDIX hydrolase [Burkholderiales bacterium]
MKYCSNCGAPVRSLIPPGDTLPRFVCDVCTTIHYQNPKIVVGCIPEWENKILLCRRAIEPRHGLWTLPAGFLENQETTVEGAIRETLEEAHARVEVSMLYALYNVPHVSQVYLLFRARLLDLNFRPGSESLEVQLFDERQIPWNQIAFRTVREALHAYFDDRRSGAFSFHFGDILPPQSSNEPARAAGI